ncbi:unnamed protein product [Rotaria sp. Silwood2]|nr:unnamed protein product [Rotaria sp. Silwood2]CAF4205903.1 unnamed protein product [Rotaria sp. Silwood2]
MASYAYRQEPSAPPMYPEVDNIRPVPPIRSEFTRHPQEENLLPPKVPKRMDIDEPPSCSTVNVGSRRFTTKTFILIFHRAFFFRSCFTCNGMQLRILKLQKQHDGIWIASLILVCISILVQIGLTSILYIIAKGDIRNPLQQIKLERYNTIAFIIIIIVFIINAIINLFMLTTNSKSFLDTRSLEILQNQN